MRSKIILLIIVLVLVVAALIYFVPSDTPDGFTKYTNEEFGFSFEYLEDWELVEYGGDKYGRIVSLQSPEMKEGLENGTIFPGYPYDFKVSYWSDINNSEAQAGAGQDSRFDYESLEEFLNDDSTTKLVNKSGETKISGISAYEVIVGGYGSEDAVMFESNGLYRLTYSNRAESAQLLESFKITE
ncbi:MAG: PsbP-related protein [Candidatus Uhrbacteria bacterium]